jgi:hypothetical protein
VNNRLFSTSFFLAILTAFAAWAFQWTFDSWKDVTFDMPGEVTVLRVTKGPQVVASVEAEEAQEELKAYFSEQSLALIVSSSGNGRPEMLVYDPYGLVPWAPECSPDEDQPESVDVYLFRGTYSERLWMESLANPFLPPEAEVNGTITAPPSAGSLQYARCIGRDLLSEGQYTFNTTSPAQTQSILSVLYRMGFVPEGSRKLPFFLYMMQNPLMVITAFFLIAGYGCVVFYWLLYLHRRSREFGIRSRHGALPANLVLENLVNGLPGLAAGSIAGGLLAGILVVTIGQVNISLADVLILGIAALATAMMAATTWLIVLFIIIWSKYEVNLAG